MPNSMTGFGRARTGGLLVEVRTVNHKNRDVSVRLPPGHLDVETRLRGLIAEKLSRGRVDLTVTVKEGVRPGVIRTNLPLAQAYLKAVRLLAKQLKMDGEVRLDRVLGWPGVLQSDAGALSGLKWEEVEPVVMKALRELGVMRAREGKRLIADIEQRLKKLSSALVFLETRLEGALLEYRNRLKSRVTALAGDTLVTDTPRFEMEVALLAERSDITEEVVRLRSHIVQMRTILKEAKPVGRRLDFLVQEMHREANTIGSKSNDVRIAHDVVQVKELLEQIREQVQNIE